MENQNPNVQTEQKEENYSLNDDRRVKVLSPGAMVAKRFFRNKVAVVGLVIIIIMFIFSFVGGVITPYEEDQLFYRYDIQKKLVGGAIQNTEWKKTSNSEDFNAIVYAFAIDAVDLHKTSFTVSGNTYTLATVVDGMVTVSKGSEELGFLSKNIIYLDEESSYELKYKIMLGFLDDTNATFTYNGSSYEVTNEGLINKAGSEIGYVSSYVVNSTFTDVTYSRDFKAQLQEFLETNDAAGNFKRDGENESTPFTYHNGETGEDEVYFVAYSAADSRWAIKQETETLVYDSYAAPSSEHWLGTDGNGMDMLTRLMYGGRVSLLIGFIVVAIESVLGIIMGGISGYFGKWVDFLIMRIVDIMYCIPSTPFLIIVGAAMDASHVDPKLRMLYLMLILGFLGWPGVAHLVRGQILSLREQEFMTAAEATGLHSSKRIAKHLVPNVMPQLIVSATMGLGGAILTEATLSFLGLGVRFPFASWGNIINDVNNTYTLTTYLWVWIPAGCCILLTVLAFNLIGDGLRDAFDPKMKR